MTRRWGAAARRARRGRAPRVAAVAAATSLLFAGCGGPDAAQLLERTLPALEEAGTARFVLEVTAAGTGGATFQAAGAQDLADGSLRMTIDLGDASRSTETLYLGDDVYVRSPLFELLTGEADRWVRIDLASAGSELGLDADALLAGHTGPAALLAQLDGASEDVEELDGEEVRGVTTRRLRVTVSTDAALAQAPAEVREQLRTYAETTGLPETYPMELWISDDGLVRRIRTVLDDDASGVTQQTTLELFDYGVSVDLQAPLADQTVDLDELVRQLEAADAAGRDPR